jgi:hypothetical protein
MTRGELRTALRRRLQEEVADRWQDTDLNKNLNMAEAEIQKEVMKVDPKAFVYTDRADVVNAQELYEWPAGCWYDVELRLKDSGGEYHPIDRISLHDKWDPTSRVTSCYYRLDAKHFGLVPVPTTNLAAGIELLWVPTLSMALDTDVPPLHIGLHYAIVLMAELISMGDTGDANDETVKELARIINSIPQYYLLSASTPPRLSVDIDKGY